mmetsp:Transcript_30629/g.72250  ORF Transcript_30629/g.72250 Transcript_30629/m.72250 type:complete len:200 (-) Transcript_30629:160-759(-)
MVVGQVSQGNGHQAQEREEEPTTVPNGPRGGLGMGRVRRGGRSSRGMRGPRSEGETPGESAVVSQGALGVAGVASNSLSLFEDGGSRDLVPACSVDNAAVDALVRRMPGSLCIARQSHDGDFVGLVRSGVHHSLLACCVAVAVAVVVVRDAHLGVFEKDHSVGAAPFFVALSKLRHDYSETIVPCFFRQVCSVGFAWLD